MPITKIPFSGPLNISVDEHALDEKESPLLINAYLDKRDNLVRRPGLTPFTNGHSTGSNTYMDGVYWWDEEQSLVAISGGNVYAKTSPDAPFVRQGSAASLPPGRPADFSVVDGISDPSSGRDPTLVITSGLGMVYLKESHTTYAGDGAGIIAPSASNPPTMSRNANSVSSLDNYLIFVETNTQSGHYVLGQSLEDPTTGIYGDFRLDSDIDNAIAVRQILETLYFFSRRHVELWQNDQQTPFSRIRGAVIDSGITERATLANIGQAFMYADKYQNIVILDGRSTENVSLPISKAWKQSQNYDLISSATAYAMYLNHNAWYVINMPRLDRTFVYDLIMKRWFEMGTWGKDNRQHIFDGAYYAYARDWNLHCFASGSSDMMYFMDETSYRDTISAGDVRPIVATSRTTDLDHGTSKRKRINRLYVSLHRGLGNAPASSTEQALLTIRWQDDGAIQWSGDKQIHLGPTGDGRHVVVIPGIGGVFRKRQWEWTISSPYQLDLISVEADIQEMTS
jgi:hypothetical protein